MQKLLLSAGWFFLHNICKTKKWVELCYEHDEWIAKFSGFLRIALKRHLSVQKRPIEKQHFRKNIKLMIFFLVLKHWITFYSSNIATTKTQRKYLKDFPTKVFLETFWTFKNILSYSWLNPHFTSFWSSPSCTGWFTIRDFLI